jgi:hypothetical protein
MTPEADFTLKKNGGQHPVAGISAAGISVAARPGRTAWRIAWPVAGTSQEFEIPDTSAVLGLRRPRRRGGQCWRGE